MRRLVALSCNAALTSSAPLWAAGVHVAVLAAFVAAWGDGTGVPVWSSWSFYTQLRALELAILVVLLPWTSARVLPAADAGARVALSGLTGAPPSWLLLTRAAGGFCAVAMVSLAPLPVAVLAQRLSGGSLLKAGAHEGSLLGLGATAVVIHLWVERHAGSPVTTWAITSCALAVAVVVTLRLVPGPTAGAAVLSAAAAITLVWLAGRADREHLYLPEPAA